MGIPFRRERGLLLLAYWTMRFLLLLDIQVDVVLVIALTTLVELREEPSPYFPSTNKTSSQRLESR